MANSNCPGPMLFASRLNSSVMLGNYLQQTTPADDIFRSIFSLRFKETRSATMNIFQKKLFSFKIICKSRFK